MNIRIINVIVLFFSFTLGITLGSVIQGIVWYLPDDSLTKKESGYFITSKPITIKYKESEIHLPAGTRINRVERYLGENIIYISFLSYDQSLIDKTDVRSFYRHNDIGVRDE